jgi:RNA polymerase sigma-70 factor (ECF subfamily)
MTPNLIPTNPSLLGRLRNTPRDESAWREFVGRYAQPIFQWCIRKNLQEADARDVTQEVLVKLAVCMQTFSYDSTQSFRGWLWTLTRNAISDWYAESGRHRSLPLELEGASGVQAKEELIVDLSRAFDLELLDEAYACTRSKVQESTWMAFQLCAIERVPCSEVARQLNMTVGAVYSARSTVQKRIRFELDRLEKRQSQ